MNNLPLAVDDREVQRLFGELVVGVMGYVSGRGGGGRPRCIRHLPGPGHGG